MSAAALVMFVAATSASLGMDAPDFAWGRGDSAHLLAASRQAWQLGWSSPAECVYTTDCYILLDRAIEHIRMLERSRTLYHRALASHRPTAALLAREASFEAFLARSLCHAHLLAAAGRLGAAASMADRDDLRNYCIQSAESSVDSLGAAAHEAESCGRSALAEDIRRARWDLLDRCERSRITGSTSGLRQMDGERLLGHILPELESVSTVNIYDSQP